MARLLDKPQHMIKRRKGGIMNIMNNEYLNIQYCSTITQILICSAYIWSLCQFNYNAYVIIVCLH